MVKLCSMVSLGNPSAFVLHQEQGMSRAFKDFVPLVPSPGVGQDATRSGFLSLRPLQFEEPWKPIDGLLESGKCIKIDSTVRRPVLTDVQVKDACPSSVLFSNGIAKNCTRNDKILQYLISGSSKVGRVGLDLLGPHELQFVPLNYPSSELHAKKHLVDFWGDLTLGSKITVHPDGRIILMGIESEMQDLLSFVSEFYMQKDSIMCGKQSLLVPYFDRLNGDEAQGIGGIANLALPKLQAPTVAPLKSPVKTKPNPSQKKKKNRKLGRVQRGLSKKNTFHALESLLSLMFNKRRHSKSAINSLKMSGPELPHLLTRFSAGIAGTGLAVVFSVISRVACGKVPLCASKLVNTGFGFGLVWLAWAVNGLRNTIVWINKSSNKSSLKENDNLRKIDTSVKEIYFRAATLMAFAILKLA